MIIYGYCRVSTTHQKINRQITNIKEVYPDAIIVKEFFTGTTNNRPMWDKLMKQVVAGDTIVFDSVSRMSRNSNEGFVDYKNLYNKGVNLIFRICLFIKSGQKCLPTIKRYFKRQSGACFKCRQRFGRRHFQNNE